MNDIVNVKGLRVTARNDMGEDVPIVHGADFSSTSPRLMEKSATCPSSTARIFPSNAARCWR